jgi:DNA-binding transcriptional LysR family regulator
MERLETRELAYFLAVADELHFSRAAARLGIAQPALSKAIIQLERRLDVRLFERNSRAVALTPAGEVLASEARYALDAITAASRRTRRAAGQEPGLILAMKAGMDAGLLPMILAAYEREPDSLPVQVMFGTDYARLLRDGHADVALLYDFDDLRGFDTEPLRTEPRVAVFPVGHRLADRTGVTMADLRGEEVHSRTDKPGVAAISELMQLIVLGQKIAVLPASLTTPLREELVRVPVTDAPPITLLLAWPASSTSTAVAALARAASAAAELVSL